MTDQLVLPTTPSLSAAAGSGQRPYPGAREALAWSRDRMTALRALMASPPGKDSATGSELLPALLEAKRHHLPRFHPR